MHNVNGIIDNLLAYKGPRNPRHSHSGPLFNGRGAESQHAYPVAVIQLHAPTFSLSQIS